MPDKPANGMVRCAYCDQPPIIRTTRKTTMFGSERVSFWGSCIDPSCGMAKGAKTFRTAEAAVTDWNSCQTEEMRSLYD